MTVAPFPADARAAKRLAELRERVGDAVAADVEAVLAARRADPRTAATIPAELVGQLCDGHGLASANELALLALPLAARMARPPISGYRVGVIGVEAGGDLVLGANLEFPGTDLATTIHGEGFASLRARSRGQVLVTLALTEAHPCAHCRQTLAESIGADGLRLIDPLGHELRLWDLYPWPFTPAVLGIGSDGPAREAWPDLALETASAPKDIEGRLLVAGRRAHAPYSRCPSAAVLRLRDGRLLAAGCVESVSFNPTITAMQAALVELAAVGASGADIEAAWLGRTAGGRIDPEPASRALLGAAAPDASCAIVEWRTNGAVA